MTREVRLVGGPADGQRVMVPRIDRFHYEPVEGGHAVYAIDGGRASFLYIRTPPVKPEPGSYKRRRAAS